MKIQIVNQALNDKYCLIIWRLNRRTSLPWVNKKYAFISKTLTYRKIANYTMHTTLPTQILVLLLTALAIHWLLILLYFIFYIESLMTPVHIWFWKVELWNFALAKFTWNKFFLISILCIERDNSMPILWIFFEIIHGQFAVSIIIVGKKSWNI